MACCLVRMTRKGCLLPVPEPESAEEALAEARLALGCQTSGTGMPGIAGMTLGRRGICSRHCGELKDEVHEVRTETNVWINMRAQNAWPWVR